jgi:ABC-type uncharacterized transport system substrate-binding protein
LAVDSGGVYDQVKGLLRPALAQVNVGSSWADTLTADTASAPPNCVVTLGVRSMQLAAARAREAASWANIPVLAVLVPHAAFKVTEGQLPRGSSAVWLDQPTERELNLLRVAMPTRRRVGLLLSPSSEAWVPRLEAAAIQRGLELVKATVQSGAKDLFPALQTVLGGSDVLLALPDAALYNTDTLQNVLIAAYRQRVPILSYAAAHTRAGATLALHTPVEQVVGQMTSALRALVQRKDLPDAEGPLGFGVSVNEQVARSLGLELPAISALELALRRLEGRT